MLKSNQSLLIDWFIKFFPTLNKELFDPKETRWNLERYLKEILEAKVENNLSPSLAFSVAAATINAKTEFSRHLPKTLEDKFTLIHQNQLFVISSLLKKQFAGNGMDNLPLGAFFKKALQEMENHFYKPEVDSISVHNSCINYSYNVPLRNHSARISIEQEKQGTFLIRAHLLGDARDRWPNIAFFVQALDQIQSLHLAKPFQLGNQELSFAWLIHKEEEIDFAIELFNGFCEYATSDRLQPLLDVILNKNLLITIVKCHLENPTKERANNQILQSLIINLLGSKKLIDENKELLSSIADLYLTNIPRFFLSRLSDVLISYLLESKEGVVKLSNYLSGIKDEFTTLSKSSSTEDQERQIRLARFLLLDLFPLVQKRLNNTKYSSLYSLLLSWDPKTIELRKLSIETSHVFTEIIQSLLRDGDIQKVKEFIEFNGCEISDFVSSDVLLDWVEEIVKNDKDLTGVFGSLIVYACIFRKKDYERAFQFAQKYSEKGPVHAASQIFSELVQKGVYQKEAFAFIQNNLSAIGYMGGIAAALIEKNLYISEILSICSSVRSYDIRDFCSRAYRQVFFLGTKEAYPHQHEAWKQLSAYVISNNTPYDIPDLYAALTLACMNPSEFLPDALSCAHLCIQKSNLYRASEIFKYLVNYDLANQEAFAFAKENLGSGDALSVLIKLKEKGKYLKEIEDLLKDLKESS
ncbi:MAG: hypothetical protein JSS09_04415 [Verrucomicrobia bacterium]|nr:hypothetical protein [Verrucomicrobiota bacterium]